MALYRKPMEPCSTPLPIQNEASIRSSGMQCESPEMITCGLCRYSGIMAFWFSATVLVDGLQHTHCPFSVDDGEAPASYPLLEWSVSAISSLDVIADVQMRGLIYPHKCNCPILSQFHDGYVIYVWHFR